ncbi:MAG: trypsin-like peptidase domain-containing protein [Candidatus Paceibacterota bacterium]
MKDLFEQQEAQVLAGLLALLIIITATAVINDLGHQRSLDRLNEKLVEMDTQLLSQKTSISNLDEIITALAEGNEELQSRLADERARRAEIEAVAAQNQSILQEGLSSLQTQIENETRNFTNLIEIWDDRVAKLHCEFSNQSTRSESNGSGVATVQDGILSFLTNKHVVFWDDQYLAEDCEITLPSGQKFDVDPDDISVSESLDIAHIQIGPLSESGTTFTQLTVCSAVPSVGDEVVILGYPSVGSKDSITATEGIISGFDGEYYVTSAKIERGNSGGAAIHLRNNCFLGIPTLVYVGRLESLARILPL